MDNAESISEAIREVVEFARSIPGFHEIEQTDQISLLKAGTFEVRKLLKLFVVIAQVR